MTPPSIVGKSSTTESNRGNDSVYQACDMSEKFQKAVHVIRKQPIAMLPLLLELTGSQGGQARMPTFHFAFPGRRGWDLAKLPKSTVKNPCWVQGACFWPALILMTSPAFSMEESASRVTTRLPQWHLSGSRVRA